MSHQIGNEAAAAILANLDLGSTVAETDTLLETARVQTSVFDDLLGDRVDLIPGTKGSGKSALYRIFVDFLPAHMLDQRRVVIAHGVQERQDTVFLAYKEQFDALVEADFVDFWCIYLISLANEQFIKNKAFAARLADRSAEVSAFKLAYRVARIPEFERPKSLKEILGWTLAVLSHARPSLKWKPPGDQGQLELSINFPTSVTAIGQPGNAEAKMPAHIEPLIVRLQELLERADLSLWLMVDRLDELFARRSETERRALRGLLRSLRLFSSSRIRLKVFLRDDIFEHIVRPEGFTALTHITSRMSDTLRWSEDQILDLIVKRLVADPGVAAFLGPNISDRRFIWCLRTPCIDRRIKVPPCVGYTTTARMDVALSLRGT